MAGIPEMNPLHTLPLGAIPSSCLTVSVLQVESVLFPELKGYNLALGTVNPEEKLVSDYMDQAFQVYQKNQVGPKK